MSTLRRRLQPSRLGLLKSLLQFMSIYYEYICMYNTSMSNRSQTPLSIMIKNPEQIKFFLVSERSLVKKCFLPIFPYVTGFQVDHT